MVSSEMIFSSAMISSTTFFPFSTAGAGPLLGVEVIFTDPFDWFTPIFALSVFLFVVYFSVKNNYLKMRKRFFFSRQIDAVLSHLTAKFRLKTAGGCHLHSGPGVYFTQWSELPHFVQKFLDVVAI